MDPPGVDRRWLKRFGRPSGQPGIRLVCFHHAGGSAATYRHWPRLLPPEIELVAVQLPGRADRFGEPPFDRMAPLLDELVDKLKPLLDQPFVCYGVSMGSRVAWALSHALRERAMPMPGRLYLACDAAPTHDDGTWPWQGHAGGLAGYLREMGGTPPEVLANPEVLQAMLPTLRADLEVLSTHGLRPDVPLDLPILAFAGTEDPTAPPDRMAAWRTETTGRFHLLSLRSGHFMGPDSERRVIGTIAADLTSAR